MMPQRVIRIVVSVACLAALGACARFARPGATAPAARAVGGSPGDVAEARSAFSAALTPAAVAGSVRVAPEDSAPRGTLELVFRRDDVLEYQITISNADHTTYGSGYLYRMGARSRAVRVATLFTDASLSGPYVQLRGTGMIDATLTARDLLSAIRTAPGTYSVRVVPVGGVNRRLEGRLR